MPKPKTALDVYLQNVEQLEPEISTQWPDPIAVSTAISLKRIADTMQEMLIIQQADRHG